jgi:GNAT superfamily N-acetyltransferase
MEIRSITASQARSVRLPVLRPGLPPESAIFERDDDPQTLHFGAFDGERLCGVVTFFPERCPLRTRSTAWRLRGMATLADVRGRGAGRALVAEGVRVAEASGATLLWCNARISASGFYEKLGFSAAGERFELPATGPHYVMIKALRRSS